MKILDIKQNFIIVAICYSVNGTLNSDFCSYNHLDIFVWSKSRLNVNDSLKQIIFQILEKNCIKNINEINFSNSDEETCLNNNLDHVLTADLSFSINKNNIKLAQIPFGKLATGKNDSLHISKKSKINKSSISTIDYLQGIDLEVRFNLINKSLDESITNHKYPQIDYKNNNSKVNQMKDFNKKNDKSKKINEFNITNFLNENDINSLKNNDQKDFVEKKQNQIFINKVHGNKIKNEIPSSQVKVNDICKKIDCPITYCSFGRKKNKKGCETCDCLKNPDIECKIPLCHPCFYGSYTDQDGCESCACRPRPKTENIYECPKLECPTCNYGSIKDEYGCESCICIRPNSPERSFKCPPEPICPFGKCEYGSILDEYGCSTCDCLKSNSDRNQCSKLRCTQNCLYGYFTDKNGCETCNCKPQWMSPCYLAKIDCPIDCEFGTYLDRNGCPSCECLPDPSLKTSCDLFKKINSNTECDENGKFLPRQCNQEQ